LHNLLVADRGDSPFDENADWDTGLSEAILLLSSNLDKPMKIVEVDPDAHYSVTVMSTDYDGNKFDDDEKGQHSRNILQFIKQTGIEVRTKGVNTFHGLQIKHNPILLKAYNSISRSYLYELNNHQHVIISVVLRS
jgi:hypothetical protein